jgi:nucleotide-binding universal stress UspA family protein
MRDPDGPIVIAFDGSAAARQAVTDAAALLGRRPTLVVTVWEAGLGYAAAAPPPDVSMAPIADPSLVAEVDRELRARAERLAGEGAELARSRGLDAEPLAVPDAGDAAQTILNVARDRHAAAVVVGSRGLSGLRARIEGSTSKGVLKGAHCPVMVVHDDADEG